MLCTRATYTPAREETPETDHVSPLSMEMEHCLWQWKAWVMV